MSEIKLNPTPSPAHTKIRTPLARVRGLGSAKEGSDHFWKQRVTAVSNVLLVLFLAVLLVRVAGADYATVKKTLQKPVYAILLLLLVLSGIHHMRLGMQTIIEDYLKDGAKVLAVMANSFFAYTIGLTCIFAVLKLAFAG